MTGDPIFISATSLADAWKKTILEAINKGKELTPFILSITEFEDTLTFQSELDRHLLSNNHQETETVAGTIFPEQLYRYVRYKRDLLYEEYNRSFPRIQSIATANRRGTYFQRMIAYKNPIGNPVNQLENIILSLTEGNVNRRSKLQISIFDATQDHLPGPFQGFPCLQHLTFYKSKNDGLVLNSFYAMQYLYEKAYGNWLGLVNLGKFVARESGLDLHKLNLYAGIEKLEVPTRMLSNLL
jgi:thymidylate synthase